MTTLRFEQRHLTGASSSRANIDAQLTDHLDGTAKPTGVESKLEEIYGTHKDEFGKGYWGLKQSEIWDGFPHCLALAHQIMHQPEPTIHFERLDAAQLLKHALALKRSYGPQGFRLIYVWYRLSNPENQPMVAQHEAEIQTFCQAINGDFEFHAMTHQEAFQNLLDQNQQLNGHPAYRDYLRGRYF